MIRIAVLSLLAFAGITATAQTFPINPGTCGLDVNSPATCIMDVGSPNSLGVYPTMHFTDTFASVPTANSGSVAFSTLQATGGYLGSAVIAYSVPVWSTVSGPTGPKTEVVGLTIVLSGNYAPASGGAPFKAYATVNFAYRETYYWRTGWRWTRSVTSGALTVSSAQTRTSGTSGLQIHPNYPTLCYGGVYEALPPQALFGTIYWPIECFVNDRPEGDIYYVSFLVWYNTYTDDGL